MSKLLSNLTAAALLVHALAGCCWHHGHDCRLALAATERDGLAAACHYDDACGGHSHDQEPVGEEQRHGDDRCQTAPCAFVATQSGPTVPASLVQQRDVAAVAPATIAGCPEVYGGRGMPSLAAADCLPLRLHLLNRVLLI